MAGAFYSWDSGHIMPDASRISAGPFTSGLNKDLLTHISFLELFFVALGSNTNLVIASRLNVINNTVYLNYFIAY